MPHELFSSVEFLMNKVSEQNIQGVYGPLIDLIRMKPNLWKATEVSCCCLNVYTLVWGMCSQAEHSCADTFACCVCRGQLGTVSFKWL